MKESIKPISYWDMKWKYIMRDSYPCINSDSMIRLDGAANWIRWLMWIPLYIAINLLIDTFTQINMSNLATIENREEVNRVMDQVRNLIRAINLTGIWIQMLLFKPCTYIAYRFAVRHEHFDFVEDT